MTRPDIRREALVSLRPSVSEPPHESVADFIKALLTLALLCAAGYSLVIALVGYVPVVR